jgi:hypothetical protein
MTIGRLLLAVLVVLIIVALVLARGSEAALSSQAKLRKSSTVVAWYEGKGAWHLRPGFRRCSEIRFARPAARCYRHRLGYRWHKERIERLTPRPTLSHLAGWLCIHSREGAWNDEGDPYWGGLQMGWWFMQTYGADLLRAKGPASNWTPGEQMAAAEGAYVMSGYSDSFMRGQWPRTYPPCAHLF